MSDTKPPGEIWIDRNDDKQDAWWDYETGCVHHVKYILAGPAEAKIRQLEEQLKEFDRNLATQEARDRIKELERKALRMVARINDQDLEAYEKDDRIKELEAEVERLKKHIRQLELNLFEKF